MEIATKLKFARFLLRASDTRAKLTGAMKAFGSKEKHGTFRFSFRRFSGLSYAENHIFFGILGDVLQNPVIAVTMLFTHNVIVVSLILLGMSFYGNLVVLNFFKREKYADVIITHPRTFALIFTGIIVFLSILRGATLINGGVTFETLPLILLISTPVGIVEGYGIYLTIKKTLSRTITLKALAYIYGVFFAASLIEVGFINLLIQFAT